MYKKKHVATLFGNYCTVVSGAYNYGLWYSHMIKLPQLSFCLYDIWLLFIWYLAFAYMRFGSSTNLQSHLKLLLNSSVRSCSHRTSFCHFEGSCKSSSDWQTLYWSMRHLVQMNSTFSWCKTSQEDLVMIIHVTNITNHRRPHWKCARLGQLSTP